MPLFSFRRRAASDAAAFQIALLPLSAFRHAFIFSFSHDCGLYRHYSIDTLSSAMSFRLTFIEAICR
jgi:hypothetical protein